MLGIKPYIAFNGNCQEAIDFYKEKLGAVVLFSQTWGESPMAEQAPGHEDKIMHVSLKIGDSVIMACDNMSDHSPNVGDNISLTIGTYDVAEADRAFEQMSDGAKILMPMQETFWAQRFGMLTDKFGINWMFNCEKPREEQQTAAA